MRPYATCVCGREDELKDALCRTQGARGVTPPGVVGGGENEFLKVEHETLKRENEALKVKNEALKEEVASCARASLSLESVERTLTYADVC
jgi:hypothetical protein